MLNFVGKKSRVTAKVKLLIVDKVLQILCHLDMLHELVLIAVHAHKGTKICKYILKGISKLEGINIIKPLLESTNTCKYVLKGIRKLEGINITKLVLDMGINDKLCQA